MSNDVIDDTDLASRKIAHLVRLFDQVYRKTDWSKIPREINAEFSWMNYAFQLTEGFTKAVGQWTNSFVATKIKKLIGEYQVNYLPQLVSYLYCLLDYLCPDAVKMRVTLLK